VVTNAMVRRIIRTGAFYSMSGPHQAHPVLPRPKSRRLNRPKGIIDIELGCSPFLFGRQCSNLFRVATPQLVGGLPVGNKVGGITISPAAAELTKILHCDSM